MKAIINDDINDNMAFHDFTKIESQEKIDFANFIYGILLVTVIVLRLFFTIGVLSGEAKSKE